MDKLSNNILKKYAELYVWCLYNVDSEPNNAVTMT